MSDQHQELFDPPPVKPGPFGLHYSVLDHRGRSHAMAPASWSQRLKHAAGASRFVPRFSLSVSSLGMLALILAGVFAMQETGARIATTFGRGSDSAIFVVKAASLFGPLIVIGLLLVAGTLFSAVRIWMPAVARYWLSRGECPSCRYTLAGLEPAQDGCVVCPECGGAWNLGRPASTRSDL